MIINKNSLCLVLSLFSFSFLISCKQNFKKKFQLNKDIYLTHVDSIWINFLTAMDKQDINYLINNSLDSIECADCKLANGNDEELYKSNIVFKNHLPQLMHVNDLKNREYARNENADRLQIVYSIKSKHGEGTYSLIFEFTKIKNTFLFRGMILT